MTGWTRDFLRRVGPTTFMVGMAGFGAWLYSGIDPAFNLTGYIAAESHDLAPQSGGVIDQMLVGLGDEVSAGDPLLVLADTGIDARIAVTKKEIDRVRAEIALARADADSNDAQRSRELSGDVESARAALAAERARLAEARAEAQAVQQELKDLGDAAAAGFGDANALRDLKVRLARAKEARDAAGRTVSVLEANLGAAKTRSSDSVTGDAALAVAPLERQMGVLRGELDALELQRERLTVRSPIDGVIGDVLLRRGEVAGPNAPALTVLNPKLRQLVVCIPERSHDALKADALIEFTRRHGDRAEGVGHVSAVDPRVRELPERCQPGSMTHTRGTLAFLNLDADAAPILGASYDIAILEDGVEAAPVHRTMAEAPSEAASLSVQQVAAPELALETFAMHVPPALLARTRFELSGAVWEPEADAYLAVSDDTGHKGVDARAPFVFAIGADGSVATEPVALVGVEEIDDLEGIARTPEGQILLATSQGTTRSGKRRAARELLLRADYREGALHVSGSFSLRAAVEAAAPELRRALGATGDDFEVEGIDVRDGDLYVGLKEPLDGGQALIWKIANVEAAFDAGALDTTTLALHATVSLDAPDGSGGRTPGGIADLRWATDGALWIAATPSDPAVEADVGALFRLPARAGAQAIHVVDALAGKPEALAWTPEGDALFVGYDTDAAAAVWSRLPTGADR